VTFLFIIIIIQYLYSALKSCKGYRGAGGFRLRLSEEVCFEVFLKGVYSVTIICFIVLRFQQLLMVSTDKSVTMRVRTRFDSNCADLALRNGTYKNVKLQLNTRISVVRYRGKAFMCMA